MFSALKSRVFVLFFSTILAVFSFLALPQQAAAITPNTDPDVPKNSHTYTQTMLIDVLSAISCQIAGIDPIDQSKPCLTVNPDTHKIGYAPQDDTQLGGVIGILADQVGVLYTPPAASGHYVSYLASNFGIVKPALAATSQGCGQQDGDPRDGVGFCSLNPVFELWKITLNVAYLLLVLVFIFIGLAVMLRIKIDPRTVMTVQNQIPRVVICIILITLSYGISGFMIDMMWTGTYVGINAILQGPQDVELPGNSGNNDKRRLSSVASTKLLDTPISYFNQVMRSQDDGVAVNNDDSTTTRGFSGGLFHVTQAVSRALGGLIRDVITQLLGGRECSPVKAGFQAITLGIFGSNEVKDCISETIGKFFGFAANIVSWLIILVAILISLFRVWFKLLQAYIHILFYVIAAPIWIAMGLIPGRPLGFENWMRNMFANMAVFPLTAFLFVAMRIFMDAFNVQDGQRIDPNQSFIPPLVGNPNMEVFGTLLAFGVILMAPGILDLLKEKLKAQGTKMSGLATATLVAGAGAATAIPKRQWSSLTARDQYGRATGPLSSKMDDVKRSAFIGINKVPVAKRWARNKLQRMNNQYQYGTGLTDEQMRKYGKWTPTDKNATVPGQVAHAESRRPQQFQGPQGGTTGQTTYTQGQRPQWSPQNGGPLPGLSQPKGPQSPTTPGSHGAARTLPEGWRGTPDNSTKNISRIGQMGQSPQKPELASWKKPSEGVAANTAKDMSRVTQMGQSPQKPGSRPESTARFGNVSASTINAGKLNVSGGITGGKQGGGDDLKPVGPPIKLPQHPWKEGIKDAGHSIAEGWKGLGKAEQDAAESARTTGSTAESSGQITDVKQAAAHNEVKTKQMAEEFAHRMSKYQEHKTDEAEAESSAQPAKTHGSTIQKSPKSESETSSMHPGGQSASGGHVTEADVDRQTHFTRTTINTPETHITTEPQHGPETSSMHPGGQRDTKPTSLKPVSSKPENTNKSNQDK